MEFKIDELASRAGTTSRNIRAYQQRGLLPGPRLVGRTGYYSEEHLRRLEIIGRLQERGFSLEAIRQTLEAWSQGGDLRTLVGFHHVLTAPFIDEPAQQLDAAQLAALFPEAAEQPRLIAEAVAMGLLAERDDGRFDVPSPLLIEAGAELVRAGVPLGQIFDLVKVISSDVADIADRFVELVARNLFDPVTEGARSPEQVRAVTDTVQRLWPLGLDVVRVFLAHELRRAADESVTRLGLRIDGDSHAG